MNLNELVGCYDNQRIFTLTRTAAGVGEWKINRRYLRFDLGFVCLIDLSSRQKIRTTNDIFEMILENDDEIKFDECGILKVVTHSKSTFVMV